MRVVLDTNVLISACWSPGGLEAHLVQLAIARAVVCCVTGSVLAEYRDVAARPKFAARQACFVEMLAQLEAAAELVEPGPEAGAATDPDDNRLLECAAGAQAEWLITGNLRHFPASYAGTRIANARAFFTATQAHPPAPASPSAGP
ncbi:MAG: putative toxin-antitoxin system toxin component, PIN family [Bryobacteraceae bacterium]|nr:putative toxin-antitoxin system toxin component, PIN family [Bryobacteraceae bacterium]